MTENYGFPSRSLVAVATIGLILFLVGADLNTAARIDPFAAPPPVALGSGQAPAGAHCTDE
jgi:hypothetical protein